MTEYQPQYQPGNGGGWPAQPPSRGPGGPDGRRADRPGPGRRPRRRHRGLTALVVLVVLLAVAAAAADQVARVYAQDRAAAQLQSSLKLSAKPQVQVAGWPFLTQALARDLKTVDVSASNVTTQGSPLAFSFTATATGVHLNSAYTSATVDHLTVRALLPFSSLDREVGGAATLSADPGAGPNGIKVGLGAAGSLAGTVSQSGSGGIALRFSAASGLAALFGGVAGKTFTIALPALASGVRLDSVSVASTGIVAVFTASHTGNAQLKI